MSDSAKATQSNRPNEHLTGGQAMARIMKLHEAGPMFGMGGFQLLAFYDAMADAGLKHNLINDERCGAVAADAWARITGRPGICDGTLGPGATNLTTGLVESLNAGVPIIAFTGDTNRDHSWKNMTQEARQLEILAPAVKEVIRIEKIQRIPELLRRAYQVATSGRPGPVLVDVPEDVCHGEHEFDGDDLHADLGALSIPAMRVRPDATELDRAAALLAGAKRPIILAGGGVHLSGAQAALTAFAEAHAIPVAHTMSGKGAIPCTHPLSLGLFGRYSRIANDVLEASDCILVIGCKLGEIATKRYVLPPREIPLIHLEIVAEEIGRCVPPEIALWGDAEAGIQDLDAALADGAERARADRAGYAGEVETRMAAWRQEVMPRLTSDESPVNMARMCHELNQVLPEDAIVVADGGFAAHWTGLLYDTKRAGRGIIANRGFASIGYGLPGSMGAQLAAPDRPVVGITGDGGFNMVIGELETAKRLGTGFTVLIVNNAASGYVKALQQALFGGHFQSSDLEEMNYAEIATAFGCHGIRVETPDQLAGAIRDGMAERSLPSVIDVKVTRDPAKMLPGVDSRAQAPARKGDRIA
ncbi:MAG: thiamine pyrophosphate-binding protein [Alphaproteobacteria bacterium]|jgi:acetolactate synthase-1/2/3 large subunit|nr:thiamine pyrophosphate-binding protein [Alphaproteobacteria bacterium]